MIVICQRFLSCRFDTIKHVPKALMKVVSTKSKDLMDLESKDLMNLESKDLMNLEDPLHYRPDKDPLNLGLVLQTTSLHSGMSIFYTKNSIYDLSYREFPEKGTLSYLGAQG